MPIHPNQEFWGRNIFLVLFYRYRSTHSTFIFQPHITLVQKKIVVAFECIDTQYFQFQPLITWGICIPTDFKTQHWLPFISLKNTVVCKLPLLRWCQHELASSANTLVLTLQLNSTTLLCRMNLVTNAFLKSRGDFKSLNGKAQTDKRQISKLATSHTCQVKYEWFLHD